MPESPPSEQGLPPPISITLHGNCRRYLTDRLRQVMFETYAGVPIGKFPEDLRVYEHLLWISRADVVVEIGTQHGGSALWFRDRLADLARYGRIREGHVVAIDIDIDRARERLAGIDTNGISLMAGDVLDPELPGRVRRAIPPSARCFVVEDSAHTFETTTAALEGFTPLVPMGGYLVVEDGCVDIEELRLTGDWPRGVLPALTSWLATPQGAEFRQRRDLERYGITCHPQGFLQRIRAPEAG